MKEKQFEGNDTTRRKEQQPLLYWMTVVTLVIIVIAFVIFPAIDGGFSSSSTNAVATFMGEKIPGDYYSLYAANIQGLNNYLEQEVSNGKIDPQMVQLYFNFYKNEITRRETFDYPPFCQIIKIVISSSDEVRAAVCSDEISEKLKESISKLGLSE